MKKEEIERHKQLYLKTSYACSRRVTQNYSTSFTMGIRGLHKNIHTPIYSIYAFVRLADELVDTFQEFSNLGLLDKFVADTYAAIREKISANPVLHAFQAVVHEYHIELPLITAFFDSMNMDLQPVDFDDHQFRMYVYGSAEVVGLMCLKVFAGDTGLYEKLKPAASRLGAAFQKINFLRDLKSDFEERGRSYFPGIRDGQFSQEDKDRIIEDIRCDLTEGRIGIQGLPSNSRKGVYLAQVYFTCLLNKLEKTNSKDILKQRIRISNQQKLLLLFSVWLSPRLNRAG